MGLRQRGYGQTLRKGQKTPRLVGGGREVPHLDRADAATLRVLGGVCGAQVGSPTLVISHSYSPEAQQRDPGAVPGDLERPPWGPEEEESVVTQGPWQGHLHPLLCLMGDAHLRGLQGKFPEHCHLHPPIPLPLPPGPAGERGVPACSVQVTNPQEGPLSRGSSATWGLQRAWLRDSCCGPGSAAWV